MGKTKRICFVHLEDADDLLAVMSLPTTIEVCRADIVNLIVEYPCFRVYQGLRMIANNNFRWVHFHKIVNEILTPSPPLKQLPINVISRCNEYNQELDRGKLSGESSAHGHVDEILVLEVNKALCIRDGLTNECLC